jgi:ParB family chromosome partitioning protein
MKLEAMKRQGARTDLTCSQVGNKFAGKKTSEIVAEEAGESKSQIFRHVRLTELIPELLEMVDNDKLKQGEQHERMALNPAVELSYLAPDMQRELFDAIQADECTPSLSQAKRLKSAAQEGKLDRNGISLVLSEEKPQQNEKFSFSSEQSKKYFPSDYTPAQKQRHIEKALDYYNRYLERKRSEPVR